VSSISSFLGTIFDWINSFTHNYGLSIILFTVLFRLLLAPFDYRSRKGQREYTAKLKKIQPEIDMLNKAYKDDPQKAQQRIMEIRKREGIGLLPKGCGMMLITYPLLIAFFAVFRNLAAEHLTELANCADDAAREAWFDNNGFLWIKNIWQPDTFFNFGEVWGLRKFWIINGINGNILPTATALEAQKITDVDSVIAGIEAAGEYVKARFGTFGNGIGGNGLYIFPALAGLLQVFSMKMTGNQQPETQPNQPGAGTGRFMKIFFPILFTYFALVSTSALAIYWVVSSVCMIGLNFMFNKILDARDKKKSLTEVEGDKK